MIDVVKTTSNISFNDPLVSRMRYGEVIDFRNGVLGSSFGPISVGTGVKPSLKYRLQHHAQGLLDNTVAQSRDAQIAGLTALLGNTLLAHRSRTVGPCFQLLSEHLQEPIRPKARFHKVARHAV